MKTIKIKRQNLVDELTNALVYAGHTDRNVYSDINGNIDTRYNNYSNGDWVEIINLYSCEVSDNSNCRETAEWIVENLEFIDEEEIWCNEAWGFIPVSIELIN